MKKIFLIVSIIINGCLAFSQEESKTTEKLEAITKNLKKVNENDLFGSEIKIDNSKFYNELGKELTKDDFVKSLNEENSKLEFYVDEKNTIKIIVIKNGSTEDEKKEVKFNYQKQKPVAVGEKAPDFEVIDINGKRIDLKSLKGKVVVLNFWFVECMPCVEEMPHLNKLVEKHKDVVFLGFSLNDKEKIKTFLKKKKFNYTLLPNSKNIAEKYGVRGYPTHIVIDKDSNIIHYSLGYKETTIGEIESVTESLMISEEVKFHN